MNVECRAFIGAIPHYADKSQLEQEIKRDWPGVSRIHYKGPGCGWATVEFTVRFCKFILL